MTQTPFSAAGYGEEIALRRELDAAHAEAARPLSRDEVSEILWGIVRSLSGDMTANDLKMYSELEGLARYIHATRRELAMLRPDEIRQRHLPTAHDELGAVVNATEQATNIIMDTCDKITMLGAQVSPEVNNQLIEYVTTIFEACNFQDITGQRITKVVKALQHIEQKVEALVEAFGEELKRLQDEHLLEETPVVEVPPPEEDESWLLQGPQLPGNAIDQDEIDRLLASFG